MVYVGGQAPPTYIIFLDFFFDLVLRRRVACAVTIFQGLIINGRKINLLKGVPVGITNSVIELAGKVALNPLAVTG